MRRAKRAILRELKEAAKWYWYLGGAEVVGLALARAWRSRRSR